MIKSISVSEMKKITKKVKHEGNCINCGFEGKQEYKDYEGASVCSLTCLIEYLKFNNIIVI